jgi:hypothetical protein
MDYKEIEILITAFVILVILITEYLTAFNAKINVINVIQNPIYVYLVTELIGFHGLYLIMIVYAFLVISIIIRLIAIYANINAFLVLPQLLIASSVKVQTELLGVP